MAFDFRYPTPLPSTKGWGPGWPDCQRDKIQPCPPFVGGVNKGILELTTILVEELKDRGYEFMSPGCWGFGCRATKGGSGDVPSFHSWGLALDFNAPENPFSKTAGNTAALNNEDKWVVPFMREYGFFWLGPAIGDWMHFSFCGSPADARAMTEKARELVKDERLDDLLAGWRAHRAGQPNPGSGWKETGWAMRNEAVKNPRPDGHDHTNLAKHPHVHGEDVGVI
jgi:D-alanyl-D-alanine carboxypeptidase-like protein